MEKLASFQNNDPAVLLQLTKKLIERDFFLTFLNHSQLKVLTRIVKSNDLDVWKHFLEGKIAIEVEGTAEAEADADLGDFDDEFVTQLVMKVRYLLWEKAIDFYYLSESMLNKGLEEVTDDFELIDGLKMDEKVAEESSKDEEEPGVPVREEEDDYDDDEEEDDEKQEDSTKAQKEDEDVEMTHTNYSNDKAVIKVPAEELAEDTKKDEENSVAEVPSDLIKELNKAYHTFEYDRETLSKRRKLEKSNQQLDSDSQNEEAIKKENEGPSTDENGVSATQTASEPNLGPATFGVGSTSLRNLLNTIQSHRDQIPLDEHELRMLFMDVRKNRSKWANDERVGQEELYEACERVVLDLRGYTEHSTPFLNKVSKREAPNYGLIIKKPMDLNTVMKKLKSFSYNSKAEFVDDLMLIWNNCLTYNADPKHFLRAHAIAMQKRTQKLIPTIPDITIKHRLEIEKEEDDRDASVDPEGSSGAGAGKGLQRHTIKEEAEASVAEETPEVETVEDSEHVDEVRETNDTQPSQTAPQAETDPAPVPDNAENNADTSRQMDGNESDSDIEVDNNENQNEGDQDWRLLTAKSRANYCSERAALFDSENHLRLDAPAILRKSNEMDNFSHYLGNESVSKSNSLLDNEEPYILEYDVAGGLPGIKYRGVSTEDQDKYEQELVDKFLEVAEADANSIKSAFALSQDSGLNKVYTETITEIQEVRKICSKISLVRQMQTQSFVHHSQMKQPEIETIKEIDIDPILKLSNHDPFHELIQYPVLRRNIAKIAMQTGFETTQPFAINTLTQVAARYMSNLIKTVKTHCELVSLNHLSNDEVILVSLVENGVNKPDDLYTFVKERVLKQQAKLKDLRQKLSNFLRDLLRPGLENFTERSFEDNSEQFITGDFSSDLGDDFFGFKELGLDKEFKMLSLSIPVYLLHSRLHNSYSSAGNELKRNKYSDLEDLPPIKLAASDINDQIELIKPFYQQLVEKTKSHYVKSQKKKGESTDLPPDEELYIIEDEELPQKQRNVRPRLPPTGKISSAKKKPLSAGYFLPEVA